MIVVPLLVALGLAIRAVPLKRLLHWWDFSRRLAVVAVLGTLAMLFFISWSGVLLTTKTGVLSSPSPGSTVAVSLLAQAVTRRAGSDPERGQTLALGLVHSLHEWMRPLFQARIEGWAIQLDDSSLISASARLDGQATGSQSSLSVRVEWRKRYETYLSMGEHYRDEARRDLIEMIINGYSVYELRRLM